MQPSCQGKQRRDQTIIRTSPQLPAVCISRGERSQPVWTAHRWACQHLCPAPRCCPQPVQGPLQRGPRCCHPLHTRNRCFEHPTVAECLMGTAQCLHPLGSNLQPVLPRTTREGSPLHRGCCHQRYSSAYIFIFFNCCMQHGKSPA